MYCTYVNQSISISHQNTKVCTSIFTVQHSTKSVYYSVLYCSVLSTLQRVFVLWQLKHTLLQGRRNRPGRPGSCRTNILKPILTIVTHSQARNQGRFGGSNKPPFWILLLQKSSQRSLLINTELYLQYFRTVESKRSASEESFDCLLPNETSGTGQ